MTGRQHPPQPETSFVVEGGPRTKKMSRLLNRMVNSLQESSSTFKGSLLSEEKASRLFLTQNRVVGREEQMGLLNDVYKRVSKSHSEVVLIHGPSGIGKSTLLQAFVSKLPPSIFYVNGKFDQLQSHAPYAALVSASNQLCRQVLRRENSSAIRDRIRDVLGPEINLLGSLIPTIAKMTATTDSGVPAKNTRMGGKGFTRFKLLFRAFLRCIASRENPIVLFLDDIQWADSASMEVLRALLSDSQSKHIMIIGAYREGELAAEILRKYNLSNDTADILDDSSVTSASTHRAHITNIPVTSLGVHCLNDVIATVLGMPKRETFSLSTLVMSKTDGNAFYALNFLDMLVSRSLLTKSENGLAWTWDDTQILASTNVSDNLAAIFEARLESLPEQVRAILQIASFIGHSFTTEVLVAIVHEEQDMIETEYSFEKHSKEVMYKRIIVALKVAMAEGLLETTGDVDEYKFSHDRVQQCLYFDLMPDDVERALLHQRIGTLIWSSVKGTQGITSDFDDWVFLAAENLNRAVNLMDYSGTRYELIEVNLRAAKLAMDRSAFHLASSYLRTAVGLLEGDESWNKHYELCLDLHYTAAESEKNIACYDRSKELVAEIRKRAKTFQEQLEAYSIEVQSLAVQGNLKASINLGLSVLRQIGVKFTKKINMATVAKELALAKMAIGKRPLEDLINLPEMTDQNKLFALDLMSIVAVNAFVLGNSYKDVYAAVSIRMVRMTVRYGLSPVSSALAFVAWGTVHSVLGHFDAAIRSAQLSFDLIDKFNAEPIRGRAVIINSCMSNLWRCALDKGIQQDFLQAYHLSMSFGDISFGYYGFVSWLVSGINLDMPLNEINRRTRSVVAEGREYESSTLLMFILPGWQVLLNLSGDAENPDPSSLMGEGYDQDFAMEMKTINSKMAFVFMHYCEVMIAYTYENWSVVREILPLIRKLEKESEGYFNMGYIFTWNAICHYELYLASGNRKHRREGRRCHFKVKKWTANGTVMLSGASKLLKAMESLCVKKAPMERVEKVFKEAFMALAANRNRYFEAVANERLARMFLSEDRGTPKGLKYLERSIDLYTRWGATAKAGWLKKRYRQSSVPSKCATYGLTQSEDLEGSSD